MKAVRWGGIWVLGLLAGASQQTEPKWQIQYSYESGKSDFEICDFQFPSVTHGIAVGVIREGKREEPTSLVTSDGGQHWQALPLKETPVSLFFLNEKLGWLVTAKGLWKMVGDGKTWTKLPKTPSEFFRVYFVDENHGWAVGPKKAVLESLDGGNSWKPLAIGVATPGEDLNYSAYTWIAFATPEIGVISGWNIPPKRFAPPLPDWADPSATLHQRETPHASYTLATDDAGKKWTTEAGTLFGTISRIRFGPNGKGLGLVVYGESYRYPSEVYTLAWPRGGTRTVYRDAKFSVTDIWMTSDGTAYLAGTQVRGQIRNLIPAPIEVMTSKDLENWSPIAVDYRAEGTGAFLAAPDDHHLWMATDTGIILSLAR